MVVNLSIRSRNNVFSPGPIMEDLVLSIEVLRGQNPGFDIEFYHPENSTENKTARYEWTETASSCSSTCGGGFQIVEYKCSSITTHRKKSEVSMQMCSGPRPDSYKKSCSNLPCPAKWTVGNWSHCSKTCGGGESTRTISCVQRQNNNLVRKKVKKIFIKFHRTLRYQSQTKNVHHPRGQFLRDNAIEKDVLLNGLTAVGAR